MSSCLTWSRGDWIPSRRSSSSSMEERPSAAPSKDDRPVALGEQVTDVALLVPVAAMHERVLAEHVLASR